MKYIKIDPYVADLKCPAMAMLQAVGKRFDCVKEVYLFETIHGHIAQFEKEEGFFVPGDEDTGKAGCRRLDVFSQAQGFRWLRPSMVA
ncbi:hypothetical protein [Actinoplanes utahensis]|uniref:hypothetical protein n=1 Tax=Actinoplanes utahensis TaxID=1869 RepID=UPI00362232B3